ncbi:ion transporter [Kiritimatiellaeota bacterium B1221]|nr:ion transporter [Kiritimatiellaeota bacterium B1221]
MKTTENATHEQNRILFGRFEYVFQILIILSLVAFALETVPDLPPFWKQFLWKFEIFTVSAFTLEYIIRLYYCRPRLSYAVSFYGIVDLIAILPFYLSTGLDLRSLRAFRLLRLFRLLKLVRYSAAVQRYHRAFVIAREELIFFGIMAVILLYLSAVGIYYFENPGQPEVFKSVFHSMWWAVCTLSSVGYGDIIPITAGGRIFTFFVLIIGLGVVAVPSGIFASALSKAREVDE